MDVKVKSVGDPYLEENLLRTAIERSWLYGLQASVFRSELNEEDLVNLRSVQVRQGLEAAGVYLTEEFFTQPIESLSEKLTEDFTRLFLGPGHHISPHESVQREQGSGILWGKETSVVKRFMAEAGFDLEENSNIIPDHISVEIEFLWQLSEQELKALQTGDRALACAALGWQQRFISDHLGTWVESFAARVREQDEGFYAAMAELLTAFLAGQELEIEQRLRQIKG